ncbi:MAG: hypothetical protein ACSLEX_00935 [Minisyncoccota bacterium]
MRTSVTYQFAEALQSIWGKIADANKYMDDMKPWVLLKQDESMFVRVIQHLLQNIQDIALDLTPFLPETSEKILRSLTDHKITPLFPRLTFKDMELIVSTEKYV